MNQIFFAIGMKFCFASTSCLLYLLFHGEKNTFERNVSFKQMQINMLALIYVTWMFLYCRYCDQQCWVSISFFISNKVMYLQSFFFFLVFLLFLISTNIMSIFRILRDRSFSRISDGDWGKSFNILYGTYLSI